MLFGFAFFIFPVDKTAEFVQLGSGDEVYMLSTLDVCRFFGNVLFMCIGALSLCTGYLQTVHDWGNAFLARYATIVTQGGWVVFLVDMVDVVQKTRAETDLIPTGYEPTQADYRTLGACIIIGILTHGAALVGSLSFLQSLLFAIHTKTFADRGYRTELRFYSFSLFTAGLAQFILGGYLMTTPPYVMGLEDYGPIVAPLLVVRNPAFNLAVGTGQMCNGSWGIIRSLEDDTNGGFYASTLTGCLVQIVSFFTVQLDGGVPACSSLVAASVVLHLMPLMLDSMMIRSEAFERSAPKARIPAV